MDKILCRQIVGFVERGEFGLASGLNPDGTYQRVWYNELVASENVTFDTGMFLLTKAKAEVLTGGVQTSSGDHVGLDPVLVPEPVTKVEKPLDAPTDVVSTPKVGTLRLTGTVPSELWNRLGTKVLPKLRSGENLTIEVGFSVTVSVAAMPALESELRQALEDLGIADQVRIERSE